MRTLAACVLVLFAATLAGGVESGQACSCALPDPRAALEQADGAFVGTLVSRRRGRSEQAVLDVRGREGAEGSDRHDRRGRRPHRTAPRVGSRCRSGTRVGLVLDRATGAWHGTSAGSSRPRTSWPPRCRSRPERHAVRSRSSSAVGSATCATASRSTLEDARSRYGRRRGTRGLVAVCPGRQRLVEIAYVGSRRRSSYAGHERCGSSSAGNCDSSAAGATRSASAARTRSGDERWSCSRGARATAGRLGAVSRCEPGVSATLWRGAALYDARDQRRRPHTSALGTADKTLLRVDLAVPGRTKRSPRFRPRPLSARR